MFIVQALFAQVKDNFICLFFASIARSAAGFVALLNGDRKTSLNMPLPIGPCWKFHNTNFHLVKAAPKTLAVKRNPSLVLLYLLLRFYVLQN